MNNEKNSKITRKSLKLERSLKSLRYYNDPRSIWWPNKYFSSGKGFISSIKFIFLIIILAIVIIVLTFIITSYFMGEFK